MIDPMIFGGNRSEMEYCRSLMRRILQNMMIISMVRNTRKVYPSFIPYKMGNWTFENVNLKLIASKGMTRSIGYT